jgi:hypothetical protein
VGCRRGAAGADSRQRSACHRRRVGRCGTRDGGRVHRAVRVALRSKGVAGRGKRRRRGDHDRAGPDRARGGVVGQLCGSVLPGSPPCGRGNRFAECIAEQGFVVGAVRAKQFEMRSNVLPPTFRAVRGDVFRQPELALTLRSIAAEGEDWMYRGPCLGNWCRSCPFPVKPPYQVRRRPQPSAAGAKPTLFPATSSATCTIGRSVDHVALTAAAKVDALARALAQSKGWSARLT